MYYLQTYQNDIREVETISELARYAGVNHKTLNKYVLALKKKGEKIFIIKKDVGDLIVYFNKPKLEKKHGKKN